MIVKDMHFNNNIVVEFIQKIRNERKFSAKEQLIAQLKRDEQKAKAIRNLK